MGIKVWKRGGSRTINTFCRSESGVSTVIAAVLLIGVLGIFMTTVQFKYIPVWKEDAEYAHMSDVWQDMSKVKSNIDILAAGLEIKPDSRITINNPVRAGGADVPFMREMTNGGTLAINDDISGLQIIVKTDNESISYDSNNDSKANLSYTGTISYRPNNIRYVDEIYCYENGALIVSQQGRSIMKFAPDILLEKDNGSVNLSIKAVTLEGDRKVISSNTVEDIRLTSKSFDTLKGLENHFNDTSVDLIVYTENEEAWEKFFRNSAEEINLREGTDYNISKSTSQVTFSLDPGYENLYVTVYKSVIKIETGIN